MLVQHRPELLVAADGQHEGLLAPLQIHAQPAVRAVDFVAQHPGAGQAGIERAANHLPGQRRLGGESHLVGDGRLSPLLGGIAPCLGQVKLAVDQRVPLAARVGQEDADLGVLDPAGRAAVLPRHPDRVLALLQEAGLVNDQHAVRGPEMLDDVVAAQVSGRVLVPQHVAEHPLRSPGSGIADLLGKLPAVLAFRRAQQALQIQARLPSWLSPDEQLTQPHLQCTQLLTPGKDACRVCRHGSPPRSHPRDSWSHSPPNSTVELGRHVGEVRDPEHVWARRLELPVDTIEWARRGLVADRGPHRLAPHGPLQAHGAHQPRHRAARHPDPLPAELSPDLPDAIDADPAALEVQIPPGVALMDAGYGADTALRTGVSALGLTYVAGVQPHTSVWTRSNPPPLVKPWSGRGRPPTRLRRDPHHQPQSAKEIALSLPAQAWTTITRREGSLDPLTSRFARLRVRAAHRDYHLGEPRPEEWLLIEWPPEEKEPTKYWLSTLPENIAYDRLVHLAKLRWRIERDYQELKQELGLGHYEGRGWRGFHHHATLCIAAYAFLVAERATIPPSGQREAPQRATSSLPAGYRPRGAPDPAGTPRGALDSERATQAYDSPGPPPRAMSLLPPEPRLHTHPVCDAVRLDVDPICWLNKHPS